MPTVEHNGVKLNYTDTGGDGTPVLFIHGFPLNASMWDPQVQALGDKYRLIVPDLKGFGSSDAPDDRSTYSVDSYADELKAVLDDAGVDKAVIAGLSMGGYVAFAFNRKYPDAIAALVLADTKAEPDDAAGKEKRQTHQKLVESEGTSGLIDALTDALTSPTTKNSKPDVVARVKTVMDNPAPGFIGALETMKQRPDSSADLAGIGVPTLIVVGEEDPLTPPAVGESMQQQISGSEMVVVPGAGHFSNLESPEEFNQALDDFLTKL